MEYKSSKQRDLILDYMRGMSGHVSAEQLFEQLNKDHKISLATIYRNLNILADMKEIKKIALSDGFVYDKTCKPHYHFYCTKCNTLYDLPRLYDHEIDVGAREEALIGVVEGHEITFKGICKHCMKS